MGIMTPATIIFQDASTSRALTLTVEALRASCAFAWDIRRAISQTGKFSIALGFHLRRLLRCMGQRGERERTRASPKSQTQ